MSETWKCRRCKCHSELQAKHRTVETLRFLNPTPHSLKVTWTVCPNLDCKEVALVVKLYTNGVKEPGTELAKEQQISFWKLLPERKGETLPNYIPHPLAKDYEEARAIRGLSPNASAMLARRCLHGIVRDFWKTKPARLVDEIEEIKDKVEPAVWESIDAIRKMGNIGAHLAERLGEQVNITGQEAEAILDLVELLFEECYTAREEGRNRIQRLKLVAEKKTKPLPAPINRAA